MEPEDSLPCPQELANSHYPEPDESSPQLPPTFPKIHSNNIHLDLPRDLPSDFLTSILYLIVYMRATRPAYLILLDSFFFPWLHSPA
jgi:hypothetical protein